MEILWRFSNSCGVFGSSNVAFTSTQRRESVAGAPDRKTPLDRIGSALHQLENRYMAANGSHGGLGLSLLSIAILRFRS